MHLYFSCIVRVEEKLSVLKEKCDTQDNKLVELREILMTRDETIETKDEEIDALQQ